MNPTPRLISARQGVQLLLVHLALLLGVAPVRGATLHVDDFESETTTLGWDGGASPTYVSSGGPAGSGDAHLQISAIAGGRLATFNLAPQWTGDYAAIGAARIIVDLMAPSSSAPLPIRAVAMTSTSQIRWASVNPQTVPNDGVWRQYSFSLAETDLVRVLGLGTYAQLMSNVERIMLRYDPGAPDSSGPQIGAPGGALNLDNISLAAAFTPPSGDFNGDGDVTGADLTDPATGWIARFGTDLDGANFLAWQRNLGFTSPPIATAHVPEPRTAIMLGILLVARAAVLRRPRAAVPSL